MRSQAGNNRHRRSLPAHDPGGKAAGGQLASYSIPAGPVFSSLLSARKGIEDQPTAHVRRETAVIETKTGDLDTAFRGAFKKVEAKIGT
jgi:hypothetical protein